MKSFYTAIEDASVPDQVAASAEPYIYVRARVAVYDAPAAAPRVVDVQPAPVGSYIENLATTVYSLARDQGSDLPYSVIREVVENFIHADFAEPVVSILEKGRTIRFADQGPGISDKEHAVLPGFTTATGSMKPYIRGVGSGLPIVRDYLSYSGGSLAVDDNLGSGAVVTISSGVTVIPSVRPTPLSAEGTSSYASLSAVRRGHTPGDPVDVDTDDTRPVAAPILTNRLKQVLALVMESGSVGPSLVSKELKIGISTAYRDLASLEEFGLIEADGGKRTLTQAGLTYLDKLITGLH